jgi:two-component system, OmpR family, response regulator
MRVLVVEDEPTLLGQLERALTAAGYAVVTAGDGEQAHFLGAVEAFDAVVLDLGLPRRDGLGVLAQWRAEGMVAPVLILTARDGWHEKVAGIDAGADDYLSKPFHMEELLARLRALIRRAGGHASATLACGPVVLDTRAGRVAIDGHPVALTSHEFRVLAYLMHHPGEIVSRTDLNEHIYAQDHDRDSNTIEVFIGRLRRKLPAGLIETVRGLGYRLVAPPSGADAARR